MKLQELLKMIEQSRRCSYLKQCLNTLLNLIATVDSNCKHIDELVQLTYLFKRDEDDAEITAINLFCKSIADNTRANHYRTDKFDDVYVIQKALIELEDLKNESEVNALENQSLEQ